MKAPVCTDCHTAHAILQPTESEFRMQSTPICGSCHKDKLSTYRDTFHSQLGLAGRLCGDGPLLGLPRGARDSARLRSPLACQPGQPCDDLRQAAMTGPTSVLCNTSRTPMRTIAS